MTNHDLLPALARSRIAELRKHTGREPQVTRLDNGWRVALASDRVQLTMDWRRPSPRSRGWSYHSTLTIDGERRALAIGMDHFLALFHDPDLKEQHPAKTAPTTCPAADLPELGPPSEPVPALVQALYRRNLASLPEGATITLGYRGGGEWQLLATAPTEHGLVRVYVGFPADERGIYREQDVYSLLALDDRDVTALWQQFDLAALGIALPDTITPAPAGRSDLPGGSSAPEGGATSVRVRKTTVIRT